VANSDSVSIQVNPTTVNAGGSTQITANCGENVSSATVSSTAFGSQTLQATGGTLTATITVMANTPSGKFGVRLACPSGSQATADITVVAATPGASAPGPGTGGGFLAGNDDSGSQASQPADRTPLVWLGAGLGCLLAAAAVAVRTRHRAAVRSAPPPSRHDRGTTGPQ
jgi:hypothetical protein